MSSTAIFHNFKDFVDLFIGLINLITPVVASLALLSFFWGLTKFIMNAGNEAAIKDGRKLMVWGVIALFIMISIFGLVRFLNNEAGFGGDIGLPLFNR